MIYEYECPACGNVIDIERKMSDPEGEYDCPTPKCETVLKRKFSAAPIQFKGRGFYKNGG